MRVMEITEPGGPHVLRLATRPDPVPGPGEVSIAVAAAGVNRADLLQRAGLYPAPPGAPTWPGLEVSGVVDEVGPPGRNGQVRWQIGDRVCALLPGGGYAERTVVDSGLVLPVPGGLDLVDAAALPESIAAVVSNLHAAGLRAGETLMVRGGSGGIGSIAVQIGVAFGHRVVATAGGPERCRRVAALGAHTVVDHTRDDVVQQVHDATDGRGVDVLLDVLGAGALADNLAMIAEDGRLVVIGLQRGTRATLDLGLLLARRGQVIGTTLRGRPLDQRVSIVTDAAVGVWPLVGSGQVRPVVHARVPLEQAADAHRMLDSGAVFGKIVLVPGGPASGETGPGTFGTTEVDQ